jgi:biotin-(acetyl-CoA carboxylase) ligase
MGIGLNLRAPEGGFPKDIPAAALNCPMPLQQMAQTLYKQLYRDMKTLELDYQQTLRDWMSLGPQMHSPVMRQGIDGEMIQGRYAGLNEQGAILIETETSLETVYAGDVIEL